MFEDGWMQRVGASSAGRAATLAELRQLIAHHERGSQRRSLRAPTVAAPARPAATRSSVAEATLEELLPGGAGLVHRTDSLLAGLLLLAEGMREGAWGAIVGIPDLGIEGALDLGVPVERSVLVPTPGAAALEAVATLGEALPIVLARVGDTSHPVAARVAARMRAAGSRLIVLGRWPAPSSTSRGGGVRWAHATAAAGGGAGRLVGGSLLLSAHGVDGILREGLLPLRFSGSEPFRGGYSL